MPGDTEYVSLIGDMAGARGGDAPEYESRDILELIQKVFPDLTAENISIIWATHDKNVQDEGTDIVKCKDGYNSGPVFEGQKEDGSTAYYIYGIGHYEMTKGSTVSEDAAAAFKSWVTNIVHTIPVILLCHVPMQCLRGDNNGASYWNEALNYAATGTEGITTAGQEADIIRNVLFLHGHNHSVDTTEYYYGAGSTMLVQDDQSASTQELTPSSGEKPSHGGRPSRPDPVGTLSRIFYTVLTAGYLKTSEDATLVTVSDGALTLNKYSGGEQVSLGTDGSTGETVPGTVTIAAQEHVAGAAVRENETAPSCTTEGGYDEVVCCTVCGAEMERTHYVIAAAGHSWGPWTVTKEPGETEEGRETRTCESCGLTEERVIPAVITPEESSEDPGEKPSENPSGKDAGKGGNSGRISGAAVIKASAVQKLPSSGTLRTDPPATGDGNGLVFWAIIMTGAAVAAFEVKKHKSA